jgi:Fe-S-cluster containining protein
VKGKIGFSHESAERWLRYHGIHIYRVPGGYKIDVNTACEMLREGMECAVYSSRPQVCRNFFCPQAIERAKAVQGEVIVTEDGKRLQVKEKKNKKGEKKTNE